MRTRRTMVGLAAVAVALVAGACRGTPHAAFNGGTPVALPALNYYANGPVLRTADGSVYVVTTTYEHVLTRLSPDGSVDTSWGTGGSLTLPFAPLGIEEANVAADGSIVLIGWINNYHRVAIRVAPGGTVDGSYGDGGQRLLTDIYVGLPDVGGCEIAADTTFRCVGNEYEPDQLKVRDFDAAGDLTSEVTVPVDLGRFARAVPPQATGSQFSSWVSSIASIPGGAVVAAQVGTAWWDATTYEASESDIVLMRIAGGALDTSWGDDGYVLLDLEAAGSSVSQGSGSDSAHVVELAHSATAGTTVVTGIEDTPCCVELLTAAVRLTTAGDLDAAAAGGGIWPITLPDTTRVEHATASVRANGLITVGGDVPDGAGTRGVVLRYNPDGSRDPQFGTGGVASIPGSRDVADVNAAYGMVTLAARGTTIGAEGEIDVLVTVLNG